MKHEQYTLGIDDAAFSKGDSETVVFGTIMRGVHQIEGFLSTRVTIDGDDATERIIRLTRESRYAQLVKALFLDGIAMGGFNVIDINRVHAETGIPVIVVMRRWPQIEKMRKALEQMGCAERFRTIEKAGEIERAGEVFIQRAGISQKDADELLAHSCKSSLIPEPVRISHLVSSALTMGESTSPR